jgi:5-methylcytosine-specific restriction endonuclease McrA
MKQIDLSLLNETFLQSYSDSIDIDKIKTLLKELRPQSKFKNLSLNLENIIKANIKDIENKYLTLLNHYSKKEKKKIENILNYSAYRQKEKFIEHFKKLNIKSCPFCNNNYIYFYKKNARKYNTLSTLEHYYPKALYPHLSLSFHNLIPCCSICNSRFKGNKTHVGNILHPYYEDFDDKAKFSVCVDSLPIDKNIELSINLKANDISDDRCKNSIDRFQLDKIYQEHNDIAKEIWNKTQVYNESRIDELYNSFYKNLGYSKEDVKNMAFCNYLHKDDINKRNHSKLTQDILKQFDITK